MKWAVFNTHNKVWTSAPNKAKAMKTRTKMKRRYPEADMFLERGSNIRILPLEEWKNSPDIEYYERINI